MGKHSRCVIGICDNDMRYPQLYKKHSDMDEYIIMHKLKKDGSVRDAWINAIINGRKSVIQESFYTFVTASLFG